MNAALEGRSLGPNSWNLLAHYAWDTDEGAMLQGRDLHGVLASLAVVCPVPAAAARLRLLALGLRPDPSAASMLLALCNDAALARACMDLFLNNGNLVRQSGNADVAAALARTAQAWAEDMWLSSSDRLMAVRLRMRMARLGAPLSGMPEAVQSAVREALAGATDPHERHTLVNTAYSALNDAGLHAEAEALLRAELPASHSPYYFMLSLASAARRRGDIAGMLDWYEQAWRTSTGSATRLQWGTTYLTALLDTAEPVSTFVPDPKVDTASAVARIEAASAGMLDDVTATPDAFCQRNGAQLAKLAGRLSAVRAPGERTAALLALLRR